MSERMRSPFSIVAVTSTLYMASEYDIGLASNTGRLFTLDFPTGVLTSIGLVGYGMTGIDIHPTTGIMYGVTSNSSASNPRSLVTIDMTTGAGTLIGSWGTSPIPDIAFDSTGTLYGMRHIGSNNDRLVTLDLSTGAIATTIGTPSFPGGSFGMGLAFHPVTGVLYCMPKGGANGGVLYTIDKTTAVATAGPAITGSGVNWATGAMDFRATDNTCFFTGNAAGETYLSTFTDLATGASAFEVFPAGWFTYNGDTNTYVDAMVWA